MIDATAATRAEGTENSSHLTAPAVHLSVGARLALELWLLPRNCAIAFMLLYRRVISPLYGQVCKYYPSCSRYALEAFQQQGFLAGVVLSAWRVLRCNPYSRGGVDDPPVRTPPRFTIHPWGFVRPGHRKA